MRQVRLPPASVVPLMQAPAHFRTNIVAEPLHLLDGRLHRRKQTQGIFGFATECTQLLDQARLTL
ncbi:hypothetical protein BOSP111201_20955 [Bordetella sputigena]